MDAHNKSVDSRRLRPVEFFADGGFVPEMMGIESGDIRPIGEKGVVNDVGEIGKHDGVAAGRRAKKTRGVGFGFIGLRVKLSGEEPKASGAGGIETTATFGNAAFTENQDLFAVAQGFDDRVPFFESGKHGRNWSFNAEARRRKDCKEGNALGLEIFLAAFASWRLCVEFRK